MDVEEPSASAISYTLEGKEEALRQSAGGLMTLPTRKKNPHTQARYPYLTVRQYSCCWKPRIILVSTCETGWLKSYLSPDS